MFTTLNSADRRASIDAVDVATGSHKTLITAATDPAYVASGHLIYASVNSAADFNTQRGAILRGVRFDLSRLETIGDPVTITEGVAMGSTGAANYSLSPQGHLVSSLPALPLAPRRHLEPSCGLTGQAKRHLSARPPASTLPGAFLRTAHESRWTCATRATTSGSGTSPDRPCRY